jgi:hypothetical protein
MRPAQPIGFCGGEAVRQASWSVAPGLSLLVCRLRRAICHREGHGVRAKTLTVLLIIVGIGWASGAVFNLFSACLEGFQRFDLSSRIWIVQIAIRTLGIAAVLASGHGMFAGSCSLATSDVSNSCYVALQLTCDSNNRGRVSKCPRPVRRWRSERFSNRPADCRARMRSRNFRMKSI